MTRRSLDDAWFVSDVARETGLTVSTVYTYRRDGRLPPADGRDGGRLYWWPETITGWKRVGRGVGGGRPRNDAPRVNASIDANNRYAETHKPAPTSRPLPMTDAQRHMLAHLMDGL